VRDVDNLHEQLASRYSIPAEIAGLLGLVQIQRGGSDANRPRVRDLCGP
jgi:hypothetical protein